jgi:hypothetical protein
VRGELWLTPEQSIRRNMGANHAPASGLPACPAAATHPPH